MVPSNNQRRGSLEPESVHDGGNTCKIATLSDDSSLFINLCVARFVCRSLQFGDGELTFAAAGNADPFAGNSAAKGDKPTG